MLVVIDNYDSFTYNLVDYLGQIYDKAIEVFRNDKITIEELINKKPAYIVISPGPKTPTEAGISKSVIKTFAPTTPILGVCLGHQSIGEVFGTTTIKAKKLMHGKTSQVKHNNHSLFKNIPNPFIATRYHSLTIDPNTIQNNLEVIAHSIDDNEIMAISHKTYPTIGVQFHPESICTPEGITLLKNFLNITNVASQTS